MTTATRGFRRGEQDAIRRFFRARNAISGLDDEGRYLWPGWADRSVISLAHGEGIRRPHPDVIAAGVTALLDTEESALDNYLYLRPFARLTERIAETFCAEGIAEEIARNVCVDSGNTRLFFGFFFAVAEQGDVFLAPQTYYQAVNMWCDIAEVVLERVQTQRANDYKFTRDDLERWYDEQVRSGRSRPPRGLLLFNPGYTGALYTRQELEEVAEFVLEHDLVVLEDSIFTDTEFFGHSTVHLSAVDGMADRVVVVDGGSKAYGLANIRIGWGCGPAAIVDRMNYYTMATSIAVPHVAKAMALAALDAPRDYLDENIRECMARADLVRSLVEEVNDAVFAALGFEPEVPFFAVAHEPKAGHSTLLSANGLRGLASPDGGTISDSIDLTRYFLGEERVCFSPGLSNGFDDCTVRVCFGCLGSEHTWPLPKLAEVRAAGAATLERLDPSSSAGQLSVRLRAAGIDPDADDIAADEGFAAGRALLTEAFHNRIQPAAVRLALANRAALASGVAPVESRSPVPAA